MTNLTIVDDDSRLIVSFPYDASAVALLKDAVPSYARSYDPPTKRWFVDPQFGNDLTEAMIAAGHTVGAEAVRPPRPKLEPGTLWDDGYDADAKAAEILATVPSTAHGAVLRALVKKLYPDMYPGQR